MFDGQNTISRLNRFCGLTWKCDDSHCYSPIINSCCGDATKSWWCHIDLSSQSLTIRCVSCQIATLFPLLLSFCFHPAPTSFSCLRVCCMLAAHFRGKTACPCVGPGCATRLPTPGSAWSSGPETGQRNGSARVSPPTSRTLSGPEHSKYGSRSILRQLFLSIHFGKTTW